MTTTIIENLRRLIQLIEAEPDHLIDLERFEEEGSCGTHHCSLGLATQDEFFQAQGLSLGSVGVLTRPLIGEHEVSPFSQVSEGHSRLNAMFGEDSYERLFEPRGDSDWDSGIIEDDDTLTDKDLALARLRKQLAIYEDQA